MSKRQYKDVARILRKINNKKHINLTVDRENYEKARKLGYNISEVLDQFLEYLVKREKNED